MNSSNPALGETARTRLREALGAGDGSMTVAGTAVKAGVLLLLVIASAGWTWLQAAQRGAPSLATAAMVGIIVAFVIALVTIRVPRLAPWTAPVYAVLEGVGIGFVSFMANASYQGLPLQAAVATMGVAAAAVVLYSAGIVKVTEGFTRAVTVALFGMVGVYLLRMVLVLVGVPLGGMMDQGLFGLGVNLVAVAVATACLFLDFKQIEEMAAAQMPKSAEWYGAFSLLVTLVWLYLELLSLLRRLRD